MDFDDFCELLDFEDMPEDVLQKRLRCFKCCLDP